MVDHSPPRDARKRKFQQLERIYTKEHGNAARPRTLPTPLGQSSNRTMPIGQLGGYFNYGAGDDNEAPGSLPVKTKVCLLYTSVTWHMR